ncbi:MAG TPA: GerAB/ArcD/ProY family transporter, partial [Clostridia bacterium]|nr:GerAB/ArcD/ProY family transporter [Clostridia bacterium]
MNSRITDRQMFFMLFVTLTTYTIINVPKVIAQGVGTGGWFTLLITSLFFAAFVALIVRLNSAFPGLMLAEYSRQIVGKVFAIVLSLYFLVYFLLIAVYLNIQLISVLKAVFYPKTPQWVMLITSLIVFGFAAYRGVNSVARFFEIVGTVFLFTAVAVHLVMLQQGNPQEIRPFFRASQLKHYLLGTKDVIISFLG